MTDTNRDIFIALIDAGLDESAVLAFIEGRSDDAGQVVGKLGTDASLAELVWQLRADRLALIAACEPSADPARTEAMVEAVLDQELTDELDANDLAALEATGRAAAGVPPPAHPAAKARRARRLPRRARRVAFSLAAAAIVVLVVSIALPRVDLSPPMRAHAPSLAHGGAQPETPIALAPDGSPARAADPAGLEPGAAGAGPAAVSRPMERPVIVATTEEALRLAQSGRLIVRLVSSRPESTRQAARQLSSHNGLARLALVEGRLSDEAAAGIARGLPDSSPPIMASADEKPAKGVPPTRRQAVGSYMLRVEPSERALTLLLARLREQPGIRVELVGAASQVTTPASAGDIATLAGEPSSWQPRIGVPVVLEEIR